MESRIEKNNKDSSAEKIRDLDKLLFGRASSLKNHQLLEYKTSLLVDAGENFTSLVLKLEVLFKPKDTKFGTERLNLVAKVLPKTRFQNSLFDFGNCFKKEIFVFTSLQESYRKLSSTSVKSVDHLFPKYHGGRLSLEDGNEVSVADNNAVILLENLNSINFETMDRFQGLDYEHCCLAMKELAFCHALGMAFKLRSSTEFEKAKEVINLSPYKATIEKINNNDIEEHILNMVKSDPRLQMYVPKINATIQSDHKMKNLDDHWTTITHGDFWLNNLLFKHDNHGKCKKVKFIDFQGSRAFNALDDLPYFIGTSISNEVLINHLDDLLNSYYDNLINVLRNLNVDIKLFTKKSFEQNLMVLARNSIIRVLTSLKFFTFKINDKNDLNDMRNLIMLSPPNQIYVEKLFSVITTFDKKGWLL